MKQLKEHIKFILENGTDKPGRTGSLETPDASLSVFGRQLRFDLREGLPFVTAKKLQLNGMLKELCWMLRGETNTKTLGISIWDKWALKEDLTMDVHRNEFQVVQDILSNQDFCNKHEIKDTAQASDFLYKLTLKHAGAAPETIFEDYLSGVREGKYKVDEEAFDKELNALGIETKTKEVMFEKGYCGPIYGHQWRRSESILTVGENIPSKRVAIDQLTRAYHDLIVSPDSRRIIVNAWQPSLIPATGNSDTNIKNGYMGLPPCHKGMQFYHNDGTLSLMLELRSSDTMVGLPFNIGSYALILALYASVLGFKLGELITNIGDAHIYKGHIEGAKQYLDNPVHALDQINMEKLSDPSYVDAWLDSKFTGVRDAENFEQYAKFNVGLDYDKDSLKYKVFRFKCLLDTIEPEFFLGVIILQEREPSPNINFDLYE